MKVKICGITNLEDAQVAIELGADAIGFIFAPSKRQVKADTVKAIVEGLPPFVCKVGVFVDAGLDTVRQTLTYCGLDVAQLHGNESPDYCASLFPKAIKSFTIKNLPPLEELSRYTVTGYMIDREKGDTTCIDNERLWKTVLEAGKYGRVVLAGGLTPDNVARAIEAARPYAVDVTSGVEAEPGKKDKEKMRAFIAAAKRLA